MNGFMHRRTEDEVTSRRISSRGLRGIVGLVVVVCTFGGALFLHGGPDEPVRESGVREDPAVSNLAASGAAVGAAEGAGELAHTPASDASALSAARPDFGAAMQQVHFAFRPEGRGHAGRHSTYAIEAHAGRVSVTPFRYLTADGADATPEEAVEGGTLALETNEVSRDGRSLLSRRPLQTIDERGRLSVERGAVHETWSNGDAGSEQAWRLSRKPEGRGDLVVAVTASGMDYVGTTENGLHFADESRLGLRYGHATWVEANGARVMVKATYEEGRIVMRVPASVVEAAAYPAVLDPIVGPEFGMDVPQTGPSAFDQSAPSVAFDGTNYLVAWQDYRSGTSYDVYAARVAQGGAVLDGAGLALSVAAGSQRAPAVAFDGTNYLVVWEDARSGTSDIYGTRVTPEGGLLDGAGIQISVAAGVQQAPALAYDGTRYLVAWQDARSGSSDDIYATRVSAAGAVLDGTGVSVSAGTADELTPAVAAGGGSFFVVWSDARATAGDIYAARVSSTGVLTDTAGVAISAESGAQTEPAVAFDGTNFLVAWEDARTGTSDIYATRVSTAGAPLDGSGLAISAVAEAQSAPAVAFDGTTFFVAWQDYRGGTDWDLYGTRVTTMGALLDGASGWEISAAATDEQAPSVATNGAGLGMILYDGPFAPAGGTIRTIARRYCAAGVSLTDTTCDGFDDDCDGSVDEEYVTVQTGCGVGACFSTGVLTCVAGDVVDSCVAGTPAASDVTCNDEDDDCDGGVDEDYVPTQTTCGVGGCGRTGMAYCVSGAISDSCAEGTPEADDSICNGVDDDCDGSTDEEYVAPPTNCGIGACGSTGTAACVGGTIANTCVPGTPAADDPSCDGVDDDCDNATDEDYVPVATSCGFAACATTGMAYCVAGTVSDSCTPLTPPSTTDADCDQVDDDCSGVADDDYPSTPTTCGIGACARTGAIACVAGTVGDTCVPGTPASSDATCDGVDDDCDGMVDEDYVPMASACGLGACARTGTTSCVSGMEQDSCTAGSPTGPETDCDGVDDDCDGTADEDFPSTATTCGTGACASTGATSCVAGAVQDSCMEGVPGTLDDDCDGLDDDCDQQIDEDAVCATDGGIDAGSGDGSIADAGGDGSVTHSDSDGCSCKVAGAREDRGFGAGLVYAVFGLVWAARRRRRSRR